MSSYNDVLAALGDFRAELFTDRFSESTASAQAGLTTGLRGMLGELITPLQNIHATGVGIRVREGKVLPLDFVLKVYVFQKLTGLGSLIPGILSKPFHGVDIDIEEMPVLTPMAKRAPRRAQRASASTTISQHQAKRRPVVGGLQIQPRGAAFVGTLGGFVRSVSGGSDRIFALSNNHVLCDTNKLPLGTEIVQPNSAAASNVFARLTMFARINLPTVSDPFPEINRMDAAIARVTDNSLVKTGAMFGISKFTPKLLAPQPSMKVTKSGRTTGVTKGTITATSMNGIQVNYAPKGARPIIGTFDGCVQVRSPNGRLFSDQGDSGSWILDEATGQPVALLFAGGGGTTSANNMTEVCTKFGILPI